MGPMESMESMEWGLRPKTGFCPQRVIPDLSRNPEIPALIAGSNLFLNSYVSTVSIDS
jgi:hypothetical protein